MNNKFELKLLAKQIYNMFGNKNSIDLKTAYEIIDSCDNPKEAIKWLIEHNPNIDESTKNKLKITLMDINNEWDLIEFILNGCNVNKQIIENIKIIYNTSKDTNDFLKRLLYLQTK